MSRRGALENMVSLKVDNLSFEATKEDIKKIFEQWADVGDVYIPTDPLTNMGKGFAFVRFYNQKDADKVINEGNGVEVDGLCLKIKIATPSRGGYGRYRGPGGGRGGGRGGPPRYRSRSRSPRGYGGGGYGGGGGRRPYYNRSRSRSPPRQRYRRRSRSASRSPVRRERRRRSPSEDRNRSSRRRRSPSRSRSRSR